MTDAYRDWKAQLMRELEAMGTAHGSKTGGAFVDCMRPFRMGWSPKRTAAALLWMHPEDAVLLARDSVKGDDLGNLDDAKPGPGPDADGSLRDDGAPGASGVLPASPVDEGG